MADEPPFQGVVLVESDPVVPPAVGEPVSYSLPGGADEFDQAGADYWGYGCVVTYEGDTGLRGMPVAGPEGSAAEEFVRVHTGRCRKVVEGVAVKAGGKPAVPSREPGSDNEVLLDWKIACFNPQMMPQADRLFGVVWRYVYALQVPPGYNDALDSPRSPADPQPAVTHVLRPSDFTGLLVSSSPVTTQVPITRVSY